MIIQGDCLQVLSTMDEKIIQTCVTSPLGYVFFFLVCFTVYPLVATFAKCNDVGYIKSQTWITRPCFEVMSMEPAKKSFRRITSNAMVIIPLVYLTLNFFPFAGSVKALSLWCATVFVVGIAFTSCAMHPVTNASQPGLRDAGFFRQNAFSFLAVPLACKWIWYSLLRPMVFAFQVRTTRAGRYAKVNQLFVNSFWIAVDKFTDFISRQLLNDVLLIEPVFIKVRRFIHNIILIHSMAVVNV